jgi:4-hydroxy-2-oxoheptanedioate aldolase|tara:strand:- start:1370 stop:2251 length:882 start_codon:yes stop_codon:yes gene_type:complete
MQAPENKRPKIRNVGVRILNGEQLKQKVGGGGIVYGTMISMGRNPGWGRTVGAFGLDYVIIDTEHAARSRSEVADYMAAFNYTGVVPIVRVPIPASHYVTMFLDAGAQGVLAPYCETVDEVKEVVGATKWKPLKGALARKAVDLGEFPSEETKEYLENRNRNNVCIIGIESVPAIENLESILEVDGIDAIFVGPNDLSITLGVPDQYDHPDYEAALREIIEKCRAADTPVLIHHQTVELTQKWLREGARFVLYSSDARTMHNGYRDEFGRIKEVGSELGGGTTDDIGESGEII